MKTGVLVVNVGTPKSPRAKDVGVYLKEFLMDPFVVDIFWLFRWILVNWIIVPLRSKKSAKAYASIWWNEGSPLLVLTERFSAKLQKKLGKDFVVKTAMRYGVPSIKEGMESLQHCENIIVAPMYPQYAESSYRTCVEHVTKIVKKNKLKAAYQVVEPFYSNAHYIESSISIAKEFLAGKKVDHYLFSFHGLPERHIKKTDKTKTHCLKKDNCCDSICVKNAKCYRAHCVYTANKISEAFNLNKSHYTISFQSRLGRTKWIEPYTDILLPEFAEKGFKNLVVFTPSFTVDCLETLEEISLEGKKQFFSSGGKTFDVVPCLNDHDLWVEGFSKIIMEMS